MPSTHRIQFLKKHNLPSDTSLSLSEISKLSGVPVSGLQEVYNRGIGAYKSSGGVGIREAATGKKSTTPGYAGKLSKEAWAYSRVYSFVNRGKTYKTTDKDIAEKYKF